MGQTAQRTATYEDLLAVPEPFVAEILFGRLVTHSRSAPILHAVTVPALLGALGRSILFGPWMVLYRPEVHLGPHVAVPDLAAWRRERLTPFPEANWIDIAPDWICEVLSPETEARDRGEKRTIYGKAGVRYLWHVDPALRALEVFELNEGKWLLLDVFQDDAEVKAAPFADPGFRLDLLWPFDADPPAQDDAT
jgi:hypothetical protein